MGLKCRLLGHTYGEPEVERSREENGDEVVVTVREVQVCDRCGAEETVSKNREVTAIRSPSEVGLDENASGAGATPPEPNTAASDVAADTTGQAEPSATGGTQRAEPAVEPAELDEMSAESADAPAAERGPDPSAEQHASGSGDVDTDSTGDDVAEVIDRVDDDEIRDVDPAAENPGDGSAESLEDGSTGQSPDDAAGGQSERDDGWETGSDDWDDVEPDPDADDAVILDAGAAERDETQWPEETDTAPVGESADAADTRESTDEEVTNDAEIIDGDAAGDDGPETRVERERDPGAWPERDDLPGADGHADGVAAGPSGSGGAPDTDGWPEVEGDDEGFDAQAGADGDLELGGNGLTPEVNGHAESEADAPEAVEGVAVDEGPGIRRAERDGARSDGFVRTTESGTLESDVPDDRIEFYCPNCGHARMAGASSLRAGDICPECKQGYIAERER